ncbi:MAG: hypothetical protein OXI63_22030 [Candidatus Poribacteria bacterium]|nr:hypothetical protein [Candidatus Poribacteria bacterium]
MLSSLQAIYETLYDSIVTVMGDDLPTFTKGFDPKSLDFPYMYLDRPRTTGIRDFSYPTQYQYEVIVPLVAMTSMEDDLSKLLFSDDLTNPGVFTLLQAVTDRMEASYGFGLSFTPTPMGWQSPRWSLGDVNDPDTPAVQRYLENPNIAGASVMFLFDVIEDGPLPYNV